MTSNNVQKVCPKDAPISDKAWSEYQLSWLITGP